jgi:hypothetical protein
VVIPPFLRNLTPPAPGLLEAEATLRGAQSLGELEAVSQVVFVPGRGWNRVQEIRLVAVLVARRRVLLGEVGP